MCPATVFLYVELALTMEAGERLLVRRARTGDLAAFEELIVQHERAVFLTAFRLLGSREDAQDAAQEVFLRLYKHLGGFREEGAIRPWLYRVTVNVCRDALRKSRPTVGLDETPELAAKGPDPQAGLVEAQQRRMVAQGLERLPHKERAALVLRDLEGLPTREVARILGSREATVRSQIATARLKIRRFLKGRL